MRFVFRISGTDVIRSDRIRDSVKIESSAGFRLDMQLRKLLMKQVGSGERIVSLYYRLVFMKICIA